MSASPHLDPLPDKAERLALILGTVVSWALMALLFCFATIRESLLTNIVISPCVLLLTYYAFGGDIPLRFRQKGYRRLLSVPIVFWISFVAWLIAERFSDLGFD